MSFALELRCDGREPGVAASRRELGCLTRNGLTVAKKCTARTQTQLAIVAHDLIGDARAAGWRRGVAGWLCPFCAGIARERALRTAAGLPPAPRPQPPPDAGVD